jgi:hypothetical protein
MPISSYEQFRRSLTQGLSEEYFVSLDASSNPCYFDIFSHNINQATGLTDPTTPVACSKSTQGALNSSINNKSPQSLYITSSSLSTSNFICNSIIVVDRLSHQSGLISNNALAQTTNLPTAALTRYTDGAGVMAGITVYSGFSALTATVSYTNQSGNSGRVGRVSFDNTVSDFSLISLDSGDSGVRSVESLTMTSAGGSITNMGIVLFKPLCIVGVNRSVTQGNFHQDFVSGDFLGGIPNIDDNACISFITFNTNEFASINTIISGSFNYYST